MQGDPWNRAKAFVAVLLMGAGLIGLPSLPDDLARWPPILASIGGGLAWAADLVSPFSGWLGRWLVFLLGAWLFWRTLHASLNATAAAIAKPAVPGQPPSDRSPLDQASTKPVIRRKRGRIYVDSTVEALTHDLFEGRLFIHAQALIGPYIGKWMTVNGPIYEVYDFDRRGDDERRLVVSLGEEAFAHPDVTLYFARTWLSKLTALRKGEQITVTGQILSIELGKLTLDRCELETVGPAGAGVVK